MEKINACIESAEDKYFLNVLFEEDLVQIPLSEEKPNNVKAAFNKIIQRLKRGEFSIVFEKKGDDLFNLVADEYVVQLNREIREVYGEMKKLGLVQAE